MRNNSYEGRKRNYNSFILIVYQKIVHTKLYKTQPQSYKQNLVSVYMLVIECKQIKSKLCAYNYEHEPAFVNTEN
jgi:hypothetical protein